jgi:hypothetical protein
MKHKTFLISALFCVILFSAFFSAPLKASAATLYITPSSGAYRVGDLFSMLINVNTSGKAINAASGQLNFDNSKFEVSSMGYSSSIFTLWTQEPTFSNAAGSVTFSGGLPNPGFTGPSGAILRVTFKPKAQGQATVNFVSGSVLANDGKGTNILDSFSGGIFNILAAAEKPAETPAAESKPATKPINGVATHPMEAPLITDYPNMVEVGQNITIRGLTLPVSKVIVTFQKGSEDSVREETFSGNDGRFSKTFSEAAKPGFYSVWARVITNEGLVSPQSDIIRIEVTQPLFFRVGSVAFNYASIIVTLLALILFGFLIIIYGWWRVRQWQKRQGIEISEAESALHEGFDALKAAARHYIRYIAKAKSPEGMKRKEEETEEMLDKGLKDIEHEIGKEIGDIRHPKRRFKNEEK